MAPKKKRSARKKGERSRPPRHLSSSRPRAGTDQGPPALDEIPGLEEVLRQAHPLGVLTFASGLVAWLDRGEDAVFDLEESDESPTLSGFLDALLAAGTRRTDALLLVLARLQEDELLAQRIRREVAARRHAVPGWLLRLDEIRPTRAFVLGHVLGDGENLVFGVDLPGGRKATILAYVDHNLGTVVKDAFAVDMSVEDTIDRWTSELDSSETELRELSLADTRALLTEAIDSGAITFPPFETDTWPDIRPLTEWLLRLMPKGGESYRVAELTDRRRTQLRKAVLASVFARELTGPDDPDIVATLLDFAADTTPGDPLRWSPVSVEILLLDRVPRKILADLDYLDRVPEVLRAVIRYAHGERRIPSALTEQTLAAVDEFEADYRSAVRTPHRTGTAALLERMGVVGPEFDDGEDLGLGDLALEEFLLEPLDEEVGGRAALEALDAEPLPVEGFDEKRVPEELRATCREVAALIAAAADTFFDLEFRTAAYRVLTRAAAADPAGFRTRAKAETTAGAICWIVGKANYSFETGPGIQRVMRRIGLASTPTARADRLLALIGGERFERDVVVGDPTLLTSTRRRELLARRDAVLRLLDD